MYLLIMNRLDLLTKTYRMLHNYPGVPSWLLSVPRRIVRSVSARLLPTYLSQPHNHRSIVVSNTPPVIVSFTSFPARINNVWQVVECILRQSYCPQKVLLWLSKDQFPSYESIPQTLREREGDIFEIRMVDGDIRSHKKYYYVFKEYPDSLVFLIDDDLYYPTDIIERSVKEYQKGESSIICNYGFHVLYDKGKILPYKKWERVTSYSTSSNLFFGSGGGTLVDVSKFNRIVKRIDLALQLTPIADDIWLNAIARYSNIRMSMLKNGSILPINNAADVKLATQNLWDNKNDDQINKVREYFLKNEGILLFEDNNSFC